MGYDFDEIAEVVEGDLFVEPSHVSGEKGAWTNWHHFATKLSSEYPAVYDDNEEAFWRTLVADSNGEGGLAPEEFGTMYRRWRAGSGLKPGARPGEWLPSPHYTDEEIELFASFMSALDLATRGRKLFRTKRGYLGLGAWEMEPTLRIHVLHRGSLPVVGRDTSGFTQLVDVEGKEVEGVRFPIYQLVGSGGVYIHGVMDGEILGIAEEEGLTVAPVWFA
ncbi:hypothetical protein BDZ45DRAFT_296035 [Acephala macrosclerotiorum]|nr:hypothetical protein BDZ45DRAFT_296035 [Acephala macrosclerotiorum]